MELQDTQSLSRRTILQAAGTAAAFGAQNIDAQDSTVAAASARVQHSELRLTINGRPHSLKLDVRTSLLDLLREHLHLTGAKKGCNQGACGACTVLANGRRINSCLTLAVMYEGAEIVTIEGVASGEELHPLQTAFVEHDAFQCGYCTPGQILSGIACIREGHTGSDHEIRSWMSGNICRCGAYQGIVSAVAETARKD